jgi:hypothetical protein
MRFHCASTSVSTYLRRGKASCRAPTPEHNETPNQWPARPKDTHCATRPDTAFCIFTIVVNSMNVIKDFLGVNVAYTGINGVRSAMIPANTNIFPRALDEQDNCWQKADDRAKPYQCSALPLVSGRTAENSRGIALQRPWSSSWRSRLTLALLACCT